MGHLAGLTHILGGVLVRVLVTGASGLIGRLAVPELLARGHSVTTLQRGAASALSQGTSHIQADVTSAAARRAAAASEAVLHLGGRGDVMESWSKPGQYLQTVVGGTLNVLEGARSSGAVVVIPSSQRVYRVARRRLRESDPVLPQDPYALAKLMAEGYCRLYGQQYSLPTRALRLFSIFGPGQRGRGNSGVAAIFIERARSGQDLQVAAGPRRDLTYVEDAVRGLCLALEHASRGFKIYNVATGEGTDLGDLAETLVRLTSSRSKIIYPERPWRGGDLVADVSRARRELGYEPLVSLEEGLRRTLDSGSSSTPVQGFKVQGSKKSS